VKQADPPLTSQRRTQTDWAAVAREAKRKKGKWFSVGVFSVGIPNHLRKGVYRQFIDPADPTPPQRQMAQHWDITSRKVHDTDKRRVEVFIRYVG
jgi:hypothetical protein